MMIDEFNFPPALLLHESFHLRKSRRNSFTWKIYKLQIALNIVQSEVILSLIFILRKKVGVGK